MPGRINCFLKILFFAISWFLAGCYPAPQHEFQIIQEVQVKEGDEPSWALPDFDASEWRRSDFSAIRGIDEPGEGGTVWLRGQVELHPGLPEDGRALGLWLNVLATCDVFWDGQPFPSEGVPATSPELETPGPVSQILHIPNHQATPGTHLVALRCSNHHRGFQPSSGYWLLAVGDLIDLSEANLVFSLPAVVSLSGLLIVALYYFVLFVLDRRRAPYLLLSLWGFSGAFLLVAEVWRNLLGYTYDWHILRLRIVTFFAWLTGVLLAGFLAAQFPMRGRRLFLAAVAVAASLPPFVVRSWDGKVVALFLGTFVLSSFWCVLAWWQKQDGAALASIGVLICLGGLLFSPVSFGDRFLYLALDLLMVFLLASHARQVRAAAREREAALLKSARLELELLKRHLQPHFLMNTLTALAEWVEEDPETASRMIEELAGELRLLNDISGRSRILLDEELRLCRHHLAVMGLRKGCRYRLDTELVDGRALVPPAVFHTLVENALTHNRPTEEEVVLVLEQKRLADSWVYQLDAPCEPGLEARSDVTEGTGLRYLRSRLEESFGQDWQLEHGLVGSSWRTKIVVPARAGEVD